MDKANFWWSDRAPGGGNSLRFRGAQGLTRDFGVATNADVWTYSVWVKRGSLGARGDLFGTANTTPFSNDNVLQLFYNNTDALMQAKNSPTNTSPGVYRDPSAWYHIIWQNDGGINLTIFVNGVQVTQWDVSGDASTEAVNREFEHAIGFSNLPAGPTSFFNGYMAEVHFIDGQALDPADFGEFDGNGVWIPSNVNIANYGANGFHLDFSDPDNIGADRSGRGNNWTPNGFELGDQINPDWDHMEDHPTRNFATANPLLADSNNAYRKANQYIVNQNPSFGWESSTSTIKAREGRFYFEVTNFFIGDDATGAFVIGVGQDEAADNHIGSSATSWAYRSNGQVTTNGISTNYGAAYGSGDVLAAALDLDNGTLRFFRDGVDQGVAATGIPAGEYTLWFTNRDDHSDLHVNYGQRPFRFNPPAGFEPLQTQNLPAAPIPNGRDHFRAITDTGANILATAGAAFPGSLIWIKDRVNANEHQILSPLQGVNECWTNPNDPVNPVAYAAPAGNSVAWVWNCSDNFVPVGSAGTGYAGRRNVAAGFGMASFNGPSAAAFTFTHGLSAAPDFMIHKGITVNGAPWVYHRSMGNDRAMRLDNSTPAGNWTGVTFWNNTDPDATNISIGSGISNGNGGYQVYYWHAVPGYSAFGSYEGNGDPDGPFIALSFRPAWAMFKNASQSNWWWSIHDSTRNPSNPTNLKLFANEDDPEDSSALSVDLLSNGIKIRSNQGTWNNNGDTYIYAAFAENPFGGNNVSPATGR